MVKIKVELCIDLEGKTIAEFIRKIGRLSDKFGCHQESWEIE